MLKHVIWACLLPAVSHAQVEDVPVSDEPETGRRYAVEVIIFRYDIPDSVGTEIFVPDPLEDSLLGPGNGTTFSDDAGKPAPPPADALHYRILGDAELTMQDTAGMLSRLQAYEPLMHFGWVQDTRPEASTVPIPIARFGAPPEGLDGTVQLSLSRFLHFGVDLTLDAGESYAPPPAPADLSGPDDGIGRSPVVYGPLRYELKETRIIRNGETRYYDHPHFGVIARVTRADPPGAAQ